MLAFRSALHQMAGLPHDSNGPSDSELLCRFRDHRDEASFVALLQRHGPMVFAACRRMLPAWQDAEDAFQATFLVLALKPDGPRPANRLGAWLHGVACRVALKARRTAARRISSERAAVRGEAELRTPSLDADLITFLDDAIRSLPEKYRLPVVECHLAGRSRKEAAARLGWSEGTLSGRLARALDLLAVRLTRRGVGLPVTALVGALSAQPLSAVAPSSLIVSTVSIVNLVLAGLPVPAGLTQSLTKGALNAMRWDKLKIAAVMIAGLVVIGIGVVEPIRAIDEPPAASRDDGKNERPAPATRPDRAPGWTVKQSVTREHPITLVAVTADLAAIADESGNLWSWPLKPGSAPEILVKGDNDEKRRKTIDQIAFTPDGTHLYAVMNGGRAMFRHVIGKKGGGGLASQRPTFLGFSADGETWIQGAVGDKSFWLKPNSWTNPALPDPPEAIKPLDSSLTHVVFSPDSKALAALTDDGAIRIIDRNEMKVVHTIEVKGLAARAIRFSPNSKQLAVVGENGFARVYDVAKGTEACELKGNEGIVFAVAFSSDSARIATGGQDHLARIWDAITGKPLATLKGHSDTVQALAFSPDDKTLVTGSADKTVKVWEPAN